MKVLRSSARLGQTGIGRALASLGATLCIVMASCSGSSKDDTAATAPRGSATTRSTTTTTTAPTTTTTPVLSLKGEVLIGWAIQADLPSELSDPSTCDDVQGVYTVQIRDGSDAVLAVAQFGTPVTTADDPGDLIHGLTCVLHYEATVPKVPVVKVTLLTSDDELLDSQTLNGDKAETGIGQLHAFYRCAGSVCGHR